MALITPTPRAGTWLKITGTVDEAPQIRAGTWLSITPTAMGATQPRAGTWLRIDSVSFRSAGWSVGFLKF